MPFEPNEILFNKIIMLSAKGNYYTKNTMNNLKSTIYSLNIFLTVLCAGFMLYYCIVTGRYFNFLLINKLVDGFTKYYSQFRENSNAISVLNIFLGIQMIIAFLSIIFNFRKQALMGQIIALLAPIILVTLHSLTGFSQSENLINSGTDFSDIYIANYLKYNIPLHSIYVIIYASGSLLLIFQRKQI
jgi:hypothetical protein